MKGKWKNKKKKEKGKDMEKGVKEEERERKKKKILTVHMILPQGLNSNKPNQVCRPTNFFMC